MIWKSSWSVRSIESIWVTKEESRHSGYWRSTWKSHKGSITNSMKKLICKENRFILENSWEDSKITNSRVHWQRELFMKKKGKKVRFIDQVLRNHSKKDVKKTAIKWLNPSFSPLISLTITINSLSKVVRKAVLYKSKAAWTHKAHFSYMTSSKSWRWQIPLYSSSIKTLKKR